ncbi:MAG: hypothetical protein JWN30_1163 [Bacilli bacterium]|nr:hypothetical protein [Bacilli bacterium]
MKDRIRLSIFAAVSAWMMLYSSVEAAERPGPAKGIGGSTPSAAVLAYVNDFRAQAGLPALTAENSLTAAAQNHSNYMTADLSYFDHAETNTNSPYFTGVWPTDRVAAAGYGKFASLYENLALGTPYFDGVSQLFASPYHRYAFLDPGNTQFGAGLAILAQTDQYAAAPILTMEFAAPSEASAAPVVSPAAGQQNVPASWTDYESPDPLRFYKLGSNPTVGYPIVVFFSPPGSNQQLMGYHIDQMQLTESSGQLVPGYMNTIESGDAETANGPILIPKSRLHYGTTYSVSIRGSLTVRTAATGISQISFDRNWSFTTASKEQSNADTHLVVDGRWVQPDQPMKIVDGHTLIALGTLASALGLQVVSNANAQTAYVSRGQQLLILQAGHSTYMSGSNAQTVDLAIDPADQRLWVPLRQIAQLFGYSIGWDELTQTIFISSNGTTH